MTSYACFDDDDMLNLKFRRQKVQFVSCFFKHMHKLKGDMSCRSGKIENKINLLVLSSSAS